jgi:hypothetical protein
MQNGAVFTVQAVTRTLVRNGQVIEYLITS